MGDLRRFFQRALESALKTLAKGAAFLSIEPNQMSWAGFGVVLLASGIFLWGDQRTAGSVFLLGSALDMLDGALARQQERTTAFGAFLDSTLDRLGEGAMLTAIAYQLAVENHPLGVVGTMLALLGSFLTSYIRARAEALGVACTEGWITRPERVILLGTGLILYLPLETVLLLAALSLWTAVGRIRHVHAILHLRS